MYYSMAMKGLRCVGKILVKFIFSYCIWNIGKRNLVLKFNITHCSIIEIMRVKWRNSTQRFILPTER